MRVLLVTAVVLSACVPPGFTGDAGQIFFATPLSRDYASFTPWQPVAQGTHLSFTASQLAPFDFVDRRDPKAMPSASGDAIATESALEDQWTGWATGSGTGSVSWQGAGDDGFELTVAPAASIELIDTLAYYADEGYTPVHRPFPQVGHELVIAPGSWIFFEAVPRSVGGVELAYEPGWITVETDGGSGFIVDAGGHGVNVTAPAAGASGTFTLHAGDGGVTEAFTIVAPEDAAAEVSRLELESIQTYLGGAPTSIFVLVARAYRADGGVLWVPPVQWSLPADVSDLQSPGARPEIDVPRRNDLRVVRPTQAFSKIAVAYAGLDASVTLVIPVAPPPPPPKLIEPGSLGGGCSCASGSGALGAIALALLLGARRRRL